ncbi:MAG: P-loop NTPase fold protein [Faecousia sp.]
MKIMDLSPTSKNVLETYENDLIGRNLDVFHFVNLLNSIDHSASIAIDAEWGAGKTFFVKQVKLVLDAFNSNTTYIDEDDQEAVMLTWNSNKAARQLDLQPQVTVYYDAWINDNDIDPIHSLVYSILQTTDSDFAIQESSGVIKAAASFIDAFAGTNVGDLLSVLQGEDPLQQIRAKKETDQLFADFLDSLLAERGNRLVIFIDELDRCNPCYAIKLLERIKHYCANERITFVFSVNISELQHTIKRYYGEGFDACRYLDRFFNFRVSLPKPNMDEYYQKVNLDFNRHSFDAVCKDVIDLNNLTFRETTRFLQMAFTTAYKPTHNGNFGIGFAEDRANAFCISCVLPVMIGLKIKDNVRYNKFVAGKDSSPLVELFEYSTATQWYTENLLANNETYELQNDRDTSVLVKLRDKVEVAYRAIFATNYTGSTYYNDIGKLRFTKLSKEMLLQTESALSSNADYSY